jgi:hypothetical protein
MHRLSAVAHSDSVRIAPTATSHATAPTRTDADTPFDLPILVQADKTPWPPASFEIEGRIRGRYFKERQGDWQGWHLRRYNISSKDCLKGAPIGKRGMATIPMDLIRHVQLLQPCAALNDTVIRHPVQGATPRRHRHEGVLLLPGPPCTWYHERLGQEISSASLF